jgi:membrane protease YdiL (CAAX protease family)
MMDAPGISERGPSDQQLPPRGEEHLPLLQRIDPVPFAIFTLVLIFFLYQAVGGVITFFLFKGEITENNVQLVRWATLIGQLLFILLPTLVLMRLRAPRVWEFARLRVPDYRQIILTVVAVFALQQVLQGYMVMQDAIPVPAGLERLLEQIKELFEQTYLVLVTAHTPLELLFVVVVVALVPAVSEELLFRGLIQRSFEQVAVGPRGAFITGIIFAAFHLIPYSLVPLAILGCFLGYIVYRSQNITVAISAHFFNNFIACVAAYLQVDEDFVALAPAGDASPLVVITNYLFFGVVFLAATYYFVQVTEPTVRSRS